MLRYLTSGESHGPGLVTIVEGLPSGMAFEAEGLSRELARRRMGFGRGRRMSLEKDEIEILAGVRFGRTLGSPVAVVIRNTEWPKWRQEMSPDPGEPRRTLTAPRPGHADLAGMQKYDTHDARDILERASARETAARAAVGVVCQRLLAEFGVTLPDGVETRVWDSTAEVRYLVIPQRPPGTDHLDEEQLVGVRLAARLRRHLRAAERSSPSE